MSHACRRQLICAAVALLAAPLASLAQLPRKIPVVGIFVTSPKTPHYETIRLALRDLGYVDGSTIRIEWRFWEGQAERLPALVADLLRANPDVILTATIPPTRAAMRATTMIPIVFGAVGADPVEQGLVSNLARPSGNVTGLTHISQHLGGKQLQILMEAVPKTARVAVLINPTNPNAENYLASVEESARTLGVKVVRMIARKTADLEKAFATAAQDPLQGLLVQSDAFLYAQRERIGALAAKRYLPTVATFTEEVETHGLIAYGPNLGEHFRRVVSYVDRILKGVRPTDLPVELPTTFELIINMKTAKSLGLNIPPSVLLRADRVIE